MTILISSRPDWIDSGKDKKLFTTIWQIYMKPGTEVRKVQIGDNYVYFEVQWSISFHFEVQEFDVLRCRQRGL